MKKQKRLPVLMHHLVSNDTTQHAVRPAFFEKQCRMLAEQGWFGIGLDEAEEFFLKGKPLPPKSFFMTFDDGYLDNYVYALPIMRKYGHKGVVFAVSDKLDAAHQDCAPARPAGENLARFTLEDLWSGKCTQDELPLVDQLEYTDKFGFSVRRDLFMNWDEARRIEQSGIMTIAGHSTRHERVFSAPVYNGFNMPGPRMRTFNHTVIPACWGLPVFESLPEFEARAFIPSAELIEDIKGLVPQDDTAACEFFSQPDKIAELNKLVDSYKNQGRLGTFESESEQKARILAVMEKNQAALLRELGHKSRSFCWPWGKYCEVAQEQARKAGFEVFYITRPGMNPPGAPQAIHRLKVKDRADDWLLSRIKIYSRPVIGALYTKMRI